jgi:hypothetical protein
VCFNDSDTSLAVVANAGSCTANGFNDSKNNLLTDGIYTNNVHYGMGSVLVKPLRRVTTQVGYSITSVGGQTPQFNRLQPAGSLQYNYHQPLANVAIDIGHNLTAKAGWNYYQYGEKSFVGPTRSALLPRQQCDILIEVGLLIGKQTILRCAEPTTASTQRTSSSGSKCSSTKPVLTRVLTMLMIFRNKR